MFVFGSSQPRYFDSILFDKILFGLFYNFRNQTFQFPVISCDDFIEHRLEIAQVKDFIIRNTKRSTKSIEICLNRRPTDEAVCLNGCINLIKE